jgi:hypothetical protein
MGQRWREGEERNVLKRTQRLSWRRRGTRFGLWGAARRAGTGLFSRRRFQILNSWLEKPSNALGPAKVRYFIRSFRSAALRYRTANAQLDTNWAMDFPKGRSVPAGATRPTGPHGVAVLLRVAASERAHCLGDFACDGDGLYSASY